MVNECVILADDPSALVELCGISTLERLLRTLQALKANLADACDAQVRAKRVNHG